MSASTCTLPSISDLFELPRAHPYELTSPQQELMSPPPSMGPYSPPGKLNGASYYPPLKAKRKRASPSQLSVLNKVFSQTYFPSTEMRIELGKQLGMSPRTVQIWFQNKRQSLRSRTRRASLSSMEDARHRQLQHHHQAPFHPHHHPHHHPYAQHAPNSMSIGYMHHEEDDDDVFAHSHHHQQQRRRSSFDVRPSSPISPFANHEELPMVLPPPASMPMSASTHEMALPKINLPPLRLPASSTAQHVYPPSPPTSTYPSPTSIDAILHQ
ncbi:Homeodomain-like protein [Gongronella butleri]|nr:Homeodomain-like protein [Gongronella butleri]